MEGQEYYKDGVARVLDLMRDTFGTFFREYYDGEPENVPESMLPCIMVVSPAIEISASATGTDDIIEQISIIVCLNKKDDKGATSNDDLTMYRIRKIIMGQDPSTKEYLPQTMMYALRKHITLSDTMIGSAVSIDFDVDVIGESTVVQKGIVTLSGRRRAIVNVRD